MAQHYTAFQTRPHSDSHHNGAQPSEFEHGDSFGAEAPAAMATAGGARPAPTTQFMVRPLEKPAERPVAHPVANAAKAPYGARPVGPYDDEGEDLSDAAKAYAQHDAPGPGPQAFNTMRPFAKPQAKGQAQPRRYDGEPVSDALDGDEAENAYRSSLSYPSYVDDWSAAETWHQQTAPRKTRLLPEGFASQWRVGWVRWHALAYGALGLLLILALGSFSPTDNSWNSSGAQQTQNLLGQPGAILADVLIQLFGYGAFVLPCLAIVMAFQVLSHGRVPRLMNRLVYALAGLALLSAALNITGLPSHWGRPDRWGGGLGYLLQYNLKTWLWLPLWASSLLALLPGLMLLGSAMGVPGSQWRRLAGGLGLRLSGLGWPSFGQIGSQILGRNNDQNLAAALRQRQEAAAQAAAASQPRSRQAHAGQALADRNVPQDFAQDFITKAQAQAAPSPAAQHQARAAGHPAMVDTRPPGWGPGQQPIQVGTRNHQTGHHQAGGHQPARTHQQPLGPHAASYQDYHSEPAAMRRLAEEEERRRALAAMEENARQIARQREAMLQAQAARSQAAAGGAQPLRARPAEPLAPTAAPAAATPAAPAAFLSPYGKAAPSPQVATAANSYAQPQDETAFGIHEAELAARSQAMLDDAQVWDIAELDEEAQEDQGWQAFANPEPFDGAPVEQAAFDRAAYGDDQVDDDGADYDEAGYDEASYDEAGYDEANYDEANYDEASYDEANYDEASYDEANDDGADDDGAQFDEPVYASAPSLAVAPVISVATDPVASKPVRAPVPWDDAIPWDQPVAQANEAYADSEAYEDDETYENDETYEAYEDDGDAPDYAQAATSASFAAQAAPSQASQAQATASPAERAYRPDPEPMIRERKVTPVSSAQLAVQAHQHRYEPPYLDYLSAADPGQVANRLSAEEAHENARMLESVLADFNVKGTIVSVKPGPVVTLYELEPAPGTKTSRVVGLADDIARSMSALSARIAVVPGRNVIGIELPNPRRETVYFREMLESSIYRDPSFKLPLALGKDIGGDPVAVDLAKMPHLLIAGTTGSGKSVAVNTMILSLLYRLAPEQCKFIMIDPKMLELSVYDGIPHLLCPTVVDPKKAVVALNWAVREMEDRYKAMSQVGVRNIAGFNKRLAEARAKGEVILRRVQTGFNPETGEAIFEEQEMDLTPLPYIVIIIDELADLMLVAGKDIESALQRLAQMARAAGLHLVMATQRPSVDVITGTIKANFPTRISFHVTSKIDSRTILGEMGAEQLLGMGDMLYQPSGGRLKRVHGPFATDDEVEKVVSFLKAQGSPSYIGSITEEAESGEGEEGYVDDEGAGVGQGFGHGFGNSGDDLYDQAVAIVLKHKKASTSFVQRQLQIGYNRAARLIERMEEEGLISASDHVGRRQILVGGDSGEI